MNGTSFSGKMSKILVRSGTNFLTLSSYILAIIAWWRKYMAETILHRSSKNLNS
jgi:hypothetical protein